MPDPSTTRLSLYKSKSDGSELVNYTQDIGQNLDKIDAAVGFQACTSSTRPSTPYSGKPIFETNTAYRTYFSNGTSPASASWVEIPNSSGTYGGNLALSSTSTLSIGAATLSRSSGGSISSNTGYQRSGSASTDVAYSALVAGDSFDRVRVYTDGKWEAGPGNAARDTNLYRSAANTLTTDDNLNVALNLAVTGNLTVSGIGQTLFARKTADTTRTSTTTMSDDPHLTVNVAASATYTVYAYLVYQAGTTGDINVAFTQPTGAAGSWQGTGLGRGVTASIGTDGFTVRMNTNDIGTTQPRSYGGDTTNQAIQIMGIVRTSSSGAFTVQWSQAASDATGTILRTDSWMQLVRVA
ncbi:hypothetical protein [Streptomyces sp. NPDC051636]|uniref:hypothetical protein n=1 Tax=Streptomyces sp. NPDC051636 TaxID=3365663 RepID=UPI0037B43F38